MDLKLVGMKLLTSTMIVGVYMLFRAVRKQQQARFRERASKRNPGIDERMGFFFTLLPWFSWLVLDLGVIYMLVLCWFTDVMT